jgi:plasmid stability protein
MATLTIRNLPDRAMERLRERAAAERRSLNNEIVVLLEQAVEPSPSAAAEDLRLPPAVQVQRWETLCGRWRDERSWKTIAADIVRHRTAGRKVAL